MTWSASSSTPTGWLKSKPYGVMFSASPDPIPRIGGFLVTWLSVIAACASNTGWRRIASVTPTPSWMFPTRGARAPICTCQSKKASAPRGVARWLNSFVQMERGRKPTQWSTVHSESRRRTLAARTIRIEFLNGGWVPTPIPTFMAGDDTASKLRVITPRVITMRVEELASEAETSVDTIRYYQGMGLLPETTREGRTAQYGPEHASRLRLIRALADDGFTLAQIKRLIEEHDPLLTSLAAGTTGLTRTELAERSGLAEPLVDMAVSAGLIDPIDDTDDRFSADAATMLAAGKSLLEAGIPLDRLAALATRHATGIEDVVDEAIELFNEFVRPSQSDDSADLTKLFQLLLAHVTRLVAQHFHQTVMHRAADRLRDSDDTALAEALEAAETRTLTVTTEWQ